MSSKDIIPIRIDRNLWIDFVAQVKKKHLTVAKALEPLLRKFINENKKGGP